MINVNTNVDAITTAIKIGDEARRISVVGKDVVSTKANLQKLFAKDINPLCTNHMKLLKS